jgi:hypothetical protein
MAGTKRLLDADYLSHREKAKRNRVLRNLPILPQHTQQKFEETQSYVENGLRLYQSNSMYWTHRSCVLVVFYVRESSTFLQGEILADDLWGVNIKR